MKLIRKLIIFSVFGLLLLSFPKNVLAQCIQSSDPRRFCSGGACESEPCDETCCWNGSGWNCTDNCGWNCNGWWDCGGCSPNCGSPLCGQGDGCGGTCSSQDNQWVWGACQAGTFQRTSSNACQGGGSTENCLGTITGYFFDASDYGSCPGSFTGIGISGATIDADSSSINYNTTTNSSGQYTLSNVRSPDTYTLTVDPGANFIATPKFVCNSSSVTFTGQAETATRNFGFWRIYGGWFQGVGGGMYGGAGIDVAIPSSVDPSTNQRLVLDDATAGDAGLIYSGGTIDIGTAPNAQVSDSEINTEDSGYTGDRMDYTYFLAKMGIYDKTAWDGDNKPTFDPGSNDYQIFTHTGDVTIDFGPAADEKMIFLVNGNVTVDTDIDVPTTVGAPSFMAVIANGSITFTSDVVSAEGWWVGNSIVVEGTGNTATEQQFTGEGSFIGWDSISLQRDRGLTNNDEPSEIFIFRPDIMVNAPSPMASAFFIWRQENP